MKQQRRDAKTGTAKAKEARGSKTKKPAKKILHELHILNGPNLNMLGLREPEIYGSQTLVELEEKLIEAVNGSGEPIKLYFFQTNYEGEMIEYIHSLALDLLEGSKVAGVVFNFDAWAHTSIALRDAVMMLKPVPLVEVHLSNTLEREEFRHHSFFADIADYRVIGMGQNGYIDAIRWILAEMKKDRPDLH